MITKKLMVATGSYQKDGQQKTKWTEFGIVMNKDGRDSIKLNAIPVQEYANGEYRAWSGWFKVFENDRQQTPAPQPQPTPSGGNDGPQDDIPF